MRSPLLLLSDMVYIASNRNRHIIIGINSGYTQDGEGKAGKRGWVVYETV